MLTKDYITPALGGRLGNNLFMIAHAYALGLKYNKQVIIAKDQLVYEGNDYSQNIFRKLELKERYQPVPNINPAIPSDKEPSLYCGYYQSESYFEEYSENIKSLFGAPLEFIKEISQTLMSIFSRRVLVINVRRGDYLHYPNYHPTITPEYVQTAMSLIPTIEHILILSDDIAWCQDNLYIPTTCNYIQGFSPEKQLWIMSMCNAFIISNSSFSWWGAYLSREPDKTVIVPETWFGPDYTGSWDDIYCKDWKVLPTYFENGFIYPK